MELAKLIDGLPTLWPESLSEGSFANLSQLPTIGEMEAAQRVLALNVCFAVRLYELSAKACRPVMRQRRDDDPNTIETGASGGSKAYPKAINSDRITIGVIGCGQVGRAVVNGLLGYGIVASEDVVISTRQPGQLSALTSLSGPWWKAFAGYNNVACAEHADVLIVCVPPSAIQGVAKEVAPSIRPTTLVVAVCTGVLQPKIAQMFGTPSSARVYLEGGLVTQLAPKRNDMDVQVQEELVQDILEAHLKEHVDDVDGLIAAIGHTVDGHNYGQTAADDAKAIGESKQMQEKAALAACEELVDANFEDLNRSLASFFESTRMYTIDEDDPLDTDQ